MTDFYQPLSYPASDFRDSLIALINRRLSLKKQLNTEPPYVLILLLLLYAPVLSFEELLYFFETDGSRLQKLLESMTLREVVVGVTLYPHSKAKASVSDMNDSRTIKGYVLTRKGYDKVKDYTDLPYTSFKSDKYYMHAYSNGFNFLSFLTNPFCERIESYANEVGATFGRRIAGDGRSLYIDSVARVDGATLYVEQDMGNERKSGELRGKLLKYGLHAGYLADGSGQQAVVISFRKGFVNISPVKNIKSNFRYNTRYMQYAISTYEENKGLLPAPYESGSLGLLVEKIRNDEISTVYDKEILCMYEDIRKHELPISSMDDLKKLCTGFQSYACDIYFNEYNSIQEAFAVKWRNRLIKDLLADGVSSLVGSRLMDDMQAFLLNCFHMYTVPTQMMSQCLPFILYRTSFVKSSVERTLSCIPAFGGFDPKSYEASAMIENDSPYRIADSPIQYNLTLSNRYESERFIFFVENLSIDLGASVRLAAAMQCIVQGEPAPAAKNIILVALVTGKEDAAYFNSLLKLYTIPHRSCFQVLFLDIANTYFRVANGWDHVGDYYHGMFDDDYFATVIDGTDPEVLYRFRNNDAGSMYYLSCKGKTQGFWE